MNPHGNFHYKDDNEEKRCKVGFVKFVCSSNFRLYLFQNLFHFLKYFSKPSNSYEKNFLMMFNHFYCAKKSSKDQSNIFNNCN